MQNSTCINTYTHTHAHTHTHTHTHTRTHTHTASHTPCRTPAGRCQQDAKADSGLRGPATRGRQHVPRTRKLQSLKVSTVRHCTRYRAIFILIIALYRSTFACNRVRTHSITKWVIKEFDNVLIPEQDHGLFYSMEAYVIRWAFIITVVRELEGLAPGMGPFARDRQYQKSLLNSNNGRGGSGEAGSGDGRKSRQKQNENESDSDAEADSDDECRKILESGGRDRCAYFFWQGT